MDALSDDLAAESADLDRVLTPEALGTPTPAPGWSVGDQISHLWFFDQRAMMALTDPDGFADDARQIQASLTGARADPSVEQGRAIAPEELLARWREERAHLVEHARTLDPKVRVPWYGPAMSARSFITARLMETWAHGQDIVDAVGAERPPTDRLRHIAHIGVRARPFSYAVRGLDAPTRPVAVVLTGPAGERWAWDEDADESITGPALDFCLVVTQRRHHADTDLEARGDLAEEWLRVAQAFAGPAGPGREAGQFRGR